jgi:hypothetical protein
MIAANPECVPAVNRAVDQAPDPQPAVRFRVELVRQRLLGRPWRAAWPIALNVALRDLPVLEAAEWRIALSQTRRTWEAAYCGRLDSRPLFVPEDDGLHRAA